MFVFAQVDHIKKFIVNCSKKFVIALRLLQNSILTDRFYVTVTFTLCACSCGLASHSFIANLQ